MNVNDLAKYAASAEASYARFNERFRAEDDYREHLIDLDPGVKIDPGFSDSQAADFLTQFTLVDHQENTPSGFSATLLQEKDANGNLIPGQYTLAIRGTELTAQGGIDVGEDVGNIVADGLAWEQIIDLYNYWQQLNAESPVGPINEV